MKPPTEVRMPTGEPPEVAAEVVAVSRAIREELEQEMEGAVRYALTRVLAVVVVLGLLLLAGLVWNALETHGLRAELPALIERTAR